MRPLIFHADRLPPPQKGNCVTIIGQRMNPPDAPARMVALIQSGLVKLEGYEVTLFGFGDVNEAVAHAAAHADPFQTTGLWPLRI